ncbi:Peptidyl-tRNA hydrolase 2 [Cyphellophora attinorum]|uniref:peptidyl-tRNA hydrolase n=1 Tax=Cyphellophora attinorum TaxID=1664694 RepID=A0A0N0NQ89_9EURO|nr:Peptidyl-tRNA hydrolase 2 [Phialophora attinorum]KPI43628.1 Peptidyl-tRNA hydrolase 2 [Phialophora attinorum]
MSNPSVERPGPTTFALSISSLIFGLVLGYFIGSGSSIGLFGSSDTSTKSSKKKSPARSWPNSYDVNVNVGSDSSDEEFARAIHTGKSDDADDESSDDADSDEVALVDTDRIKAIANTNEEVKLMLVVRTDLGMTKGKIAAQCGHATLAVYRALTANSSASAMLRRWESHGQPKIAVKCESEDQLLMLQGQAISLGLPAKVIRDAGRTQIEANSATVLGVLGPKGLVDQVTGGLKLL